MSFKDEIIRFPLTISLVVFYFVFILFKILIKDLWNSWHLFHYLSVAMNLIQSINYFIFKYINYIVLIAHVYFNMSSSWYSIWTILLINLVIWVIISGYTTFFNPKILWRFIIVFKYADYFFDLLFIVMIDIEIIWIIFFFVLIRIFTTTLIAIFVIFIIAKD